MFPNFNTPTKQSPFSSDPFNDVLEMIFIYCARDYHTNHSGHPTCAPPNWVNVSYVSRHWRNIALNSPNLWSYLFATSRRWLEELLARSKQAPLKIRFQADETKYFDRLWFIDRVLDHLKRIQELRLKIPYMREDSQVEFICSRLSLRAPCLQELAITFEGPHRTGILFSGNTPLLHTLELTRCWVSWQSLNLTRLTTLRLCSILEEFQQSIPKVLELLNCMQNLTHLYLEHALTSAAGLLSSTEFKALRKITLPRLSRLLLIAPLSTVIVFLSRVDIPLKAQVRLDCLDDSLIDQTPLSSLFQDRISASIPRICSLEIVCPTRGKATFTFSSLLSVPETEGETPKLEWNDDVPLQVITHSRSQTKYDPVINICYPLPLTHLQSVAIRYPHYSQLSMSFWKRALRHNHEIRHLKLSQGGFPGLSLIFFMFSIPLPGHGITQNQGMHSHSDRGAAAAPVLDKLELRRMVFQTPLDMLEVQALADALALRRGLPGRLMVMEHPDVLNERGGYDIVWECEGDSI